MRIHSPNKCSKYNTKILCFMGHKKYIYKCILSNITKKAKNKLILTIFVVFILSNINAKHRHINKILIYIMHLHKYSKHTCQRNAKIIQSEIKGNFVKHFFADIYSLKIQIFSGYGNV